MRCIFNSTTRYMLNDYVDLGSYNYNGFVLNLNGNGNQNQHENNNNPSSPATFRYENNLYKWTHPCGNNLGGWNLTAHVSAFNAHDHPTWHNFFNTTEYCNYDQPLFGKAKLFSWDGAINGGAGDFQGSICLDKYHTRLQFHQDVDKTIFQSLLYPKKCGAPDPYVTKNDSSEDFVYTQIRFYIARDTSFTARLYKRAPNPSTSVGDSSVHLHYSRWEGNTPDTLTNPFNLSNQSTKKLYLNGQKAFVKYNTLGQNSSGSGYCPPTYIHLRHAQFENGTYLSFDDTDIIRSNVPVNAAISNTGRRTYEAYASAISTPDPAQDTVAFYLGDVIAIDTGNTDTLTMIAMDAKTQMPVMTVFDPVRSLLYIPLDTAHTQFIIKENLECKDCFYPPTLTKIDTTFYQSEHSQHVLDHKLEIVQPEGLFHISEGARMNMCFSHLVNYDSIIMTGPCGVDDTINICDGLDSVLIDHYKTSIIVDAGSALVLDSGSYTYIGNNAGIYVMNGGSLVIKNYAFVRIGDSTDCGNGEIIAEAGAFIHIEPGSHIEFHKTIGDTTDRHLFYVQLQPGSSTAFNGVQALMDSILTAQGILDTPYVSLEICAWDTANAPGIHNKEWGYANWMPPYATFQVRNDTLCPGEPLYIRLKRILNDAVRYIEVCRLDTINIANEGDEPNWRDTCILDSVLFDNTSPDPVCRPIYPKPDEFVYYFPEGSWHRVTIKVWNECGEFDDSIAYIYVADTPQFAISVPTTACEGTGTVTAHVTSAQSGNFYYAWEASELPDTANLNTGAFIKSYSKQFYGAVPDSFVFDSMFFRGGRKYLVSLFISNSCGSFGFTDTVNIPLGAKIVLERPLAYAQPVNGATSVKLHGYTSLADSFVWYPTTWLDRSDTLVPISSPEDSITYILTAYSGNCIATDTAHIKYNRHANAGSNDTLCFDTNTISTEMLIGFPYDMSLLIGMLHYYDPSQFMNHYNNANTGNDPEYLRYFTHFMHYWTFENEASSCAVDLYNLFTQSVEKEYFFKQQWYKQYYKDFTSFNDPDLPWLSVFSDTITNNQTLKDHLDSLVTWGSIEPCMTNIFTAYNDYVSSHVNDISAAWTRISGEDTILLNSTQNDNYFIAVDEPNQTSTYILSVITPDYAEIDEIHVYLDTALAPLFAPAMQWDSTLYFANYTWPYSPTTKYEWNFGDGSPESSDENPVHTFAQFGDTFYVCLRAYNECMDSTWCDSVVVDSNGLNLLVRIENSNPGNGMAKGRKEMAEAQKEVLSKLPVHLTNYPNPTASLTVIEYAIPQTYSTAELKITDMLGRQMLVQSIAKPIGKLSINANEWRDGLYFYSLVVDGKVSKSKILVVEH